MDEKIMKFVVNGGLHDVVKDGVCSIRDDVSLVFDNQKFIASDPISIPLQLFNPYINFVMKNNDESPGYGVESPIVIKKSFLWNINSITVGADQEAICLYSCHVTGGVYYVIHRMDNKITVYEANLKSGGYIKMNERSLLDGGCEMTTNGLIDIFDKLILIHKRFVIWDMKGLI